MQGLPDNSIKQRLIFTNCEVSTGKFFPNIIPSEALTVSQSCDNQFRKNIITCKDPALEHFINEVGGLDLDTILTKTLPLIPTVIPMLDFSTARISPLPPEIEYVGVTLTDFIRTGFRLYAGTLHEQEIVTFRTSLLKESLKTKKVILFLTGQDTIIESIWNKRDQIELYKKIKTAGFFAVTGFNFSVFGGECALAQGLNLKRSIFSTGLLEQNGILGIPHIYAISNIQVQRWIKWFELNPSVNYFCMNCQKQKSGDSVTLIVWLVETLLKKFTYLHAILQGFQCDHLHILQNFSGRIHIADKVAAKCTNGNLQLSYIPSSNSLRRLQVPKKKNKTVLLRKNILARIKYIEKQLSKKTCRCRHVL